MDQAWEQGQEKDKDKADPKYTLFQVRREYDAQFQWKSPIKS